MRTYNCIWLEGLFLRTEKVFVGLDMHNITWKREMKEIMEKLDSWV